MVLGTGSATKWGVTVQFPSHLWARTRSLEERGRTVPPSYTVVHIHICFPRCTRIRASTGYRGCGVDCLLMGPLTSAFHRTGLLWYLGRAFSIQTTWGHQERGLGWREAAQSYGAGTCLRGLGPNLGLPGSLAGILTLGRLSCPPWGQVWY